MNGLTFDGSGLLGSGLFAGDVNSWGVVEYGAIAVVAYLVWVVIGSAKADMGRSRYRR